MSYIGYDIEAMNAVPAIATACETSPAAIGWGLPQMWLHCLRSKEDVITDRHLLGFFGRARDLGETLATFGFLEPADGGWRVRGAESRLRINQLRSEAGKKGREKQLAGQTPGKRRASAGQVPSKRPANAGQTDDTANDSEGAEKGHQDGQPSGSRASAGQVPSKRPANAGHVPSMSPAHAEQTSGKRAENDVLPGQKRALTPSTISLSSSSPERESSHAHTRVQAPARETPTFPDDQAKASADAFFAGVVEHGHIGGPPSSLTERDLAELAVEYGPHFTAAVNECLALGKPWAGWRVRNPQNWLRTLCDRQRQTAAEKASRRWPPPGTMLDDPLPPIVRPPPPTAV